jgi:hypothetical protein
MFDYNIINYTYRIIIYSFDSEKVTILRNSFFKTEPGNICVISNFKEFDNKKRGELFDSLIDNSCGVTFLIPKSLKDIFLKILEYIRRSLTQELSWKISLKTTQKDILTDKEKQEYKDVLDKSKEENSSTEMTFSNIAEISISRPDFLDEETEFKLETIRSNVPDDYEKISKGNIGSGKVSYFEDYLEKPEVPKQEVNMPALQDLQELFNEIVTGDNAVDAIFVTLPFDDDEPILVKSQRTEDKSDNRFVNVEDFGDQVGRFAALLKAMDVTSTGLKKTVFEFNQGATIITHLGNKNRVFLFFVSKLTERRAQLEIHRKNNLKRIGELLVELKYIDDINLTIE